MVGVRGKPFWAVLHAGRRFNLTVFPDILRGLLRRGVVHQQLHDAQTGPIIPFSVKVQVRYTRFPRCLLPFGLQDANVGALWGPRNNHGVRVALNGRKVLQASTEPDGNDVPQVQVVLCKELNNTEKFRILLVRGCVSPMSCVHQKPKMQRDRCW